MSIRNTIGQITAWTALSGIGRIRVFRSSYFFFVAIPIAARFLRAIDPNIEIHIFGDIFHFSLALPFSWKILYFSSLFFVISISIYWLFCPNLIKDFRDFREFQEAGNSQDTIKADLFAHLHDRTEGSVACIAFSDRYCDRRVEDPIYLTEIEVREGKLAEAFWFARRILSSQRLIMRGVCFFSYLVAFSLLLIILVQNFLYVWNFTFHSA